MRATPTLCLLALTTAACSSGGAPEPIVAAEVFHIDHVITDCTMEEAAP